MKHITTNLKNVVEESDNSKKTFTKFLSNFNTLKKADQGFYFYDDRKIDYVVLKDIASTKGIEEVPTQEELDSLL